MKRFVLIGAAGYIAPRHMQAIKHAGGDLVAALDPHDAVGVLDQYFPACDFFTEFERFDRHCEKLKRKGTPVDYVVVCSPNYLHDAHIRFGLRLGADVISEKPVVLNPWNLEGLLEIEKETGRNVYVLHQLRNHPAILSLKNKMQDDREKHTVEVKYITPRGKWYQYSWKGDIQKSGGIVTNIGLHFFDVLLWLFGRVQQYSLTTNTSTTAAGTLLLDNATVNWQMSIDESMIPAEAKKNGGPSFRSLSVDGLPVALDTGFTDLHDTAYRAVLAGKGTGLTEAQELTDLLYNLRRLSLKDK